MAIDTDSIQTFTDQQLLDMVRNAKANILLGGQSYTINGRTFTRANLAELNKIEKELRAMIDDTAIGSVGLARFNRP